MYSLHLNRVFVEVQEGGALFFFSSCMVYDCILIVLVVQLCDLVKFVASFQRKLDVDPEE